VNPQVWVGLGSVFIIGASSYPVFFKSVKPGHEIFSSEKPEVIREAQDAKRAEYRRLIKEQREQQLQEEQEDLRKQQQQ
jgi:hypothetical protein